MKRTKGQNRLIPQHDYQRALQTAVSWLGERYLLAEPVRRLHPEPKPFFAETRSWMPATRH